MKALNFCSSLAVSLSESLFVHSLFRNNCNTELEASKRFAVGVGAMDLPEPIWKIMLRVRCLRKTRIPSRLIQIE